jgi:hypothetical protein
MSAPKNYVDGMLVDWGSRLFNRTRTKGGGAKRGLTGAPLTQWKSGQQGGGVGKGIQADAKVIRSKLGSIARRTPQVVVRISGGGKGMQHIGAHIDYISRNGQIELEDQDGQAIEGKAGVRGLKDEWRDGGFRIPEEGTRREALNIVLSMPAGTNELAVKRAVRDFAAKEFAEHQYVMALHTFDTDPDPKPSRNPHVHLTVKVKSLEGVRLNPRKADLQRWREGFAEALKEHGVDAAATNRQQRLQRERGEKIGVKHMRRRGVELVHVGKGADAARVVKARQTEAEVLGTYRQIAKTLASSADVEDRRLALSLVDRLGGDREQGRVVDRDRSER